MIAFGDTVRILGHPETEGLGIAGMTGMVCGETIPSAGHAELIADSESDLGFCIQLEEPKGEYWLPAEMVELINHTPGVEIKLNGVDKKWTREKDGSWREEPLVSKRNPWWKIW